MQHCWNYPVKQKLYPRLRRTIRKKPIEHYRLHSDRGKNDFFHQTNTDDRFLSCSFEYTVKKQGWMGGGSRGVKFTHSATTAPTVRSIIIHSNQQDRDLLESN